MSILTDMFKIRRSLRRKMLFYFFTSFLFILAAMLSYISIRSEHLALTNAKELSESYAKGHANFIQDKLNADMGMARAFAHSLYGFQSLPVEERMSINKLMMEHIADKNDDLLAVWTIWERRTFDPDWDLAYGRGRYTYFKEKGQLRWREEILDSEGDNVEGAYYKMKVSKEETILNPYTFSYSDGIEILETSMCIPILQDDEFIGLAGFDISLESYQEIVNQIEPIKGSKLYLLANNNTFVTNPNEDFLGKKLGDAYTNLADTFNIAEHVKAGKILTFQMKENELYYYTFAPIHIGKSNQPWSMMFKVPLNNIMEQARKDLLFSLLVGIIGLFLLLLIVWIIARYITRPIKSTTRVLQKLAKGEIENVSKLTVKTKDELQDMSDSLNTLMDGLHNTADFARKIGEGKLDTEYSLLSDNDSLGNALLEMQESLKKAKEEQDKRKIEEIRQKWITEGLAKFGDILRKNNDNLKELSYYIMKNLVDYTESTQGCIYVKHDDDKDEKYILQAAIAYDRKKLMHDEILPGDGLIGRVVHEKLTIYITDVPEDYVKITSGLGKANPRSILIVPLILNDEVFGALELVSFNEFEEHQIKFVEKIGESIASTVSSVKVTERTSRLLKESQHQREELSAQEEEMRQNLEELEATQEEAGRRESEMNALIDALGSSVLITEFDLEGKILNVNNKCVDLLGIQPKNMIGKYHKSMGLDNTTGTSAYAKFWSDLKNGKTVKRVSESVISGKVKYIDEAYIPVLDADGKIHKIVGIGYDFTKVKERDEKIAELKEEIRKLRKGNS